MGEKLEGRAVPSPRLLFWGGCLSRDFMTAARPSRPRFSWSCAPARCQGVRRCRGVRHPPPHHHFHTVPSPSPAAPLCIRPGDRFSLSLHFYALAACFCSPFSSQRSLLPPPAPLLGTVAGSPLSVRGARGPAFCRESLICGCPPLLLTPGRGGLAAPPRPLLQAHPPPAQPCRVVPPPPARLPAAPAGGGHHGAPPGGLLYGHGHWGLLLCPAPPHEAPPAVHDIQPVPGIWCVDGRGPSGGRGGRLGRGGPAFLF